MTITSSCISGNPVSNGIGRCGRVALFGLFLFFDGSFLGANMLKVVDGGWITICIAAFILPP